MDSRQDWALTEYQSIGKSENISGDNLLLDYCRSGISPRRNPRRLTKGGVSLYILWDQRNNVITARVMTRGMKSLHWQQCVMLQYVRFISYEKLAIFSWWILFDSSMISLYRKSENLHITIIEQSPSIPVMSNISSFDNSDQENLFQQNLPGIKTV